MVKRDENIQLKEDIYYLDFYFKSHYLVEILHNVSITYNLEETEFEHILITPCSILIIEIKHYGGEINIDNDGTVYQYNGDKKRLIENPLIKLKHKEKLLKDFLKCYLEIDIEVESIILIDSETDIRVNRAKDKFFRDYEFVREKIKNIERLGVVESFSEISKLLTPFQREEIANLFVKNRIQPIFAYL